MTVPVSSPAPIFILCCNRSGSSLLRYIIDTHPDIASPAELHLGEICKKLYYLVSCTLGEVSSLSETEKHNFVLKEVRKMVAGIMDNYVAAKHKQMWCEKSPNNLQFLKILKSVFPEAKYICLHRHAMDVVHSCLESSRLSLMPEQLNYVCQNSGSIVGAMVQNWVEKTQEILRFEQEYPEQCFQIKYESYILNPIDTLQAMFEFLGVSWDSALLDSVFSIEHDLGREDPKVAYSNRIHNNSIGKGAQIDTLRIPPRLIEEMNELLTKLQYPIVGSDWGVDSYTYLASESNEEISQAQVSPPMNPEEILIESFSSRLTELLKGLEGRQVIYKIILTGNQSGSWLIDLTDPDCPIKTGNGNGTADKKADCTLTFFSEEIINIVNGTVNPMELWIQGKLQVTGDRTLAEIFCWFLVGRLHCRKKNPSIFSTFMV
ncbi:MAG: hypothetical protein F6K14_23730 [Symploca sp. SIO2C1]|nr:hypothetical protein [Symploca sp. SIO2C1]